MGDTYFRDILTVALTRREHHNHKLPTILSYNAHGEVQKINFMVTIAATRMEPGICKVHGSQSSYIFTDIAVPYPA